MEDSRSRRIMEVTDYWPEVSEDLSLVTWSHATNSQAEVEYFINENISFKMKNI